MIFSFKTYIVFVLVMARILGVLITAPVFNRKEVFGLSKVTLLFWSSGLMLFLVPVTLDFPTQPFAVVLAFVTEFLVGVLIGFVMDLLVNGIEFAGSLMDTQAGLSVASLLDPSTGRTVTLISLMMKWISLMLFLSVDGHHLILTALMESYKVIPLGAPVNLAAGGYELLKTGAYLFALGVQLSAPILLVVFLIDFGFGMLNKVAEQINIFQLGFQVKPSLSLLILMATVPSVVGSIYQIMGHMTEVLLQLLNALQLPGLAT